jgi:hypothetical protein
MLAMRLVSWSWSSWLAGLCLSAESARLVSFVAIAEILGFEGVLEVEGAEGIEVTVALSMSFIMPQSGRFFGIYHNG